MKKVLIILCCLFIPVLGYSRDTYVQKKVWGTEFKIGEMAYIKSAYKLDKKQIKIVEKTFNITKERFFKYYSSIEDICRLDPVNIFIVENEKDLDNTKFFPNESVYSNGLEGNKIVFGRYFVLSNNLYIVPVLLKEYYWRKNFAHELTHYFFDECGIRFKNDDEEHLYVDDFLRDNSDVFY